uniref:Uncharacterized protein n=1 Tax=Ascaris lumbricoides TaxID=6252 RepID=A0A0M3HSL4_ASCLU
MLCRSFYRFAEASDAMKWQISSELKEKEDVAQKKIACVSTRQREKIVDSKMMRPPQYPECMSDGKGTPIDKSQFQIFAARKCYAKDDSEYKIEHHRLFLKATKSCLLPIMVSSGERCPVCSTIISTKLPLPLATKYERPLRYATTQTATYHLMNAPPRFVAVLIIPSMAFFVLSEFHNMKKPQMTRSPTFDSRTALCAQTCINENLLEETSARSANRLYRQLPLSPNASAA